jgi:hypothetical protein
LINLCGRLLILSPAQRESQSQLPESILRTPVPEMAASGVKDRV